MIYLDNAATTYPKPEAVYTAMDTTNRTLAVNAGRGSYKLAREASNLISRTKEQIRRLIGVDSVADVIISPSITIAINQIVYGIKWDENCTAYLSPYEHNAVARSVYNASKKYGFKIKQLPLDSDSLEIDIERMKYEFSKDRPYAVFCTHVSNVTGYILPVEDIFTEVKKFGGLTILDTAQSLGLIPVNAGSINADIIAFAGHKSLYGPFGVGGFINVHGINLDVFVAGGTGSDSLNLDMPQDSEGKYEASSYNITAIAGLCAALENLDVETIRAREKELTEYLISKLISNPNIRLCLPKNRDRHIGIVSFIYNGYSSEDIGTILDEDFDIAVRTGYHCAPFIHEYLNDKQSLGTVRVGLGRFNTKEDIDDLVRALDEIEE